MTSTPRLDSVTAGGTDGTTETIVLHTRKGATSLTGDLFTVDGSDYGPYVARPVSAPWGPYDPITVTRHTAEQIAHDLNVLNAGCGLSAAWNGADLIFTWDMRYRDDVGTQVVTPDVDDLYQIGGLWPWMQCEGEAAGTQATRALAKWGITAHPDNDAGNTWLVVGRDQSRQGFPRMLIEPYAVLYLYNEDDAEVTVTRPPVSEDRWHVITGDGSGAEETVMKRPAAQLADCIEAIADWITSPDD